MRVLCVGRHAFLSEHLCRVFTDVGAVCVAAVGTVDTMRLAAGFAPEAVVCEGDLLTPAVLDAWAREPALHSVPVLAVSLTRRPDDSLPVELATSEHAAVVYLPALGRMQLAGLLSTVRRAGGVSAPSDWHMPVQSPSAHQL
jgi:chemotaxis response regulator CheB